MIKKLGLILFVAIVSSIPWKLWPSIFTAVLSEIGNVLSWCLFLLLFDKHKYLLIGCITLAYIALFIRVFSLFDPTNLLRLSPPYQNYDLINHILWLISFMSLAFYAKKNTDFAAIAIAVTLCAAMIVKIKMGNQTLIVNGEPVLYLVLSGLASFIVFKLINDKKLISQ